MGEGDGSVSVYLDREYSGKVSLCFLLYTRSYHDSDPDANGFSTCSYFDSELYIHIYTDAVDTIDADNMAKALKSAINENRRRAWTYTDAVENFKSDLEKYNKALDAFRKVYSEINPLLKESQLSSYTLGIGYSYPKKSLWEEKREKAMNL